MSTFDDSFEKAMAAAAPKPAESAAGKPKKSWFLIYGPDEGTRSGGNLAYQYSLPTFEAAKAKALEIFAYKTRTPYLTIASHVPGSPPTRTKIQRTELGPEPATFYVVYGRQYDLAKEPPIARADTLAEIKKLAQAHLKETQKENVHVYAVTPGRGSPLGRLATTIHRKNGGGAGEIPKDLSRNNVIRLIREGLKKRSGKEWSITGGAGTGYGWLRIGAPPKRLVGGYITEADATELGELLGLGRRVHQQGESVASSHGHYVEYIDRAWGRKPSQHGEQYWD